MKIKRPKFEESKMVSIVRDPGGVSPGSSITGGMRVAVHYGGREVRLLVKEHLGKGDYRGQIISLATRGEPCGGLTVGEEVIFRASCIIWIMM